MHPQIKRSKPSNVNESDEDNISIKIFIDTRGFLKTC
jgi:hypothetical protein